MSTVTHLTVILSEPMHDDRARLLGDAIVQMRGVGKVIAKDSCSAETIARVHLKTELLPAIISLFNKTD